MKKKELPFSKKINKKFKSWKKKTCRCVNLFILVPIGILVVIILFIFPLSKQTESERKTIDEFEQYHLILPKRSVLEIIDSDLCFDDKHGICIVSLCSKNIIDSEEFNCFYTIHVNQDINFKNFIISCDTEEASKVQIKSKKITSQNIFLYGYDLTIQADIIKTTTIYFDSYLGTFKVENLIAEESYLNTTTGDIIIQMQESAILNTITKEKNVCLTCSQIWKDQQTKVDNNLNEMFQSKEKVFQSKEEIPDECLIVYQYKNRNQKTMVEKQKHSVLEQLTSFKSSNYDEVRCIFIEGLILMNNNNNPKTGEKLKYIKASNYDGNIYVNIVSKLNQLESQIINSSYQSTELKLSLESQKNLNSTLRSIVDAGKDNEMVYLDFRNSNDRITDFVFILMFSPIYLHVNPKFVSSLSFKALSSSDKVEAVNLSPGLCPYIFSYQSAGKEEEEELVQLNEQILLSAINSFLEAENIDVYLVMTYADYKRYKVRKEDTYPDIEGISSKIQFVVLMEISCLFILIVSMLVQGTFIFNSLKDLDKREKNRDLQKIIYYFISNNLLNERIEENEQQSASQRNAYFFIKQGSSKESQNKSYYHLIKQNSNQRDEQEVKNFNTNSFQLTIQNEQNSNSKIQRKNRQDQLLKRHTTNQNKIKLVCELNNIVSFCQRINFTALVARSIDWLQARQLNSLKLFLRLLIRRQKVEKSEEISTQISIPELKQFYQKFCYLFNFNEEYFSSDNLNILHRADFECIYDQTIVFEKENFEKQIKQKYFYVKISKERKQQIAQFIQKYGKLGSSMSFSQFNLLLYYSQTLKEGQFRELLKSRQGMKNLSKNNQKKEGSDQDLFHNTENNSSPLCRQSPKITLFQEKDKLDDQIQENISINGEEKDFFVEYRDCDYEIQRNNETENYDDCDDEEDFKQEQFCIYGVYDKVLAKVKSKVKKNTDFFINEVFIQSLNSLQSDFLAKNKPKSISSVEIQDEKFKRTFSILSQDNNKSKGLVFELNNQEYQDKNDIAKKKINRLYEDLIYGVTKNLNPNISYISQLIILIRSLIYEYLIFVQPVLGCELILIFLYLYMNQAYKFDIFDYNHMKVESTLWKDVIYFRYSGVTTILIICSVFVLTSYFLLLLQWKEKKRSLTKQTSNCYSGQLRIIQSCNDKKPKQGYFQDNTIIDICSDIYSGIIKYFYIIYFVLTSLILMLQIVYILVGLLFLVLGAIVFPRVQLPYSIFFWTLLFVVIQIVVNFNKNYQAGIQMFRLQFHSLFEKKFNQFSKKPEDKTNNNEQNQNKDDEIEVPHEHIYQNMFDYLKELNQSQELSEKAFKIFLENAQMNLNQIQLDQLYSYLNAIDHTDTHPKKEHNVHTLKVWQLKRTINSTKFVLAVKYLIQKKIDKALHSLDISYPSLCTSIIYTLVQSNIIVAIIFTIFYGFSTPSSSPNTDFLMNGVISISSVFGVFFSKQEDISQVFEDKEKIQSTVNQIEEYMHSFN